MRAAIKAAGIERQDESVKGHSQGEEEEEERERDGNIYNYNYDYIYAEGIGGNEEEEEEKEKEKEEEDNSNNIGRFLLDDDTADTYMYVPEVSNEYDPYAFISKLAYESHPPTGIENALGDKAPGTPAVTLVLDLDETLVHCSTDPMEAPDITFSVNWNGYLFNISALCRPFLQEFLDEVAPMFEVVIFTASQAIYATKILDILDPEHTWSRLRLFRNSCAFIDGNYIKDLAVLGRDLRKVVIIDNSPQAFALHYDNAIPISSWFDEPRDTDLIRLLPLLRRLAKASDVRPILRERFKLYERIEL